MTNPIPPTVGRIVLYTLPEGTRNPGATRPAIVVRVWSDICVQLQVFTDAENDDLAPIVWKTSVMFDQPVDSAPARPGTWRWMPYQLGQAKA